MTTNSTLPEKLASEPLRVADRILDWLDGLDVPSESKMQGLETATLIFTHRTRTHIDVLGGKARVLKATSSS